MRTDDPWPLARSTPTRADYVAMHDLDDRG
jgi:hypothetical protein